jgi:hypothetical protein
VPVAVQALLHCSVLPGKAHVVALVPSHLPPQVVPVPAHDLPAPSGAPAGSVVQVPSDPGTLHDWQTPEQPELQQYPSTQLPEVHWEAAVHAWPFATCPHELEMQGLVPLH